MSGRVWCWMYCLKWCGMSCWEWCSEESCSYSECRFLCPNLNIWCWICLPWWCCSIRKACDWSSNINKCCWIGDRTCCLSAWIIRYSGKCRISCSKGRSIAFCKIVRGTEFFVSKCWVGIEVKLLVNLFRKIIRIANKCITCSWTFNCILVWLPVNFIFKHVVIACSRTWSKFDCFRQTVVHLISIKAVLLGNKLVLLQCWYECDTTASTTSESKGNSGFHVHDLFGRRRCNI